jgi:hypothetical protein
MSTLRRIWDLSGWVIGGVTLYSKLKSLKQDSLDIFNDLTPAQQAQWIKSFGDPRPQAAVVSPSLPSIAPAPTNQSSGIALNTTVPSITVAAPTLTQVKAGT